MLISIYILDILFLIFQSQNRRIVDLIFNTFVINVKSDKKIVAEPRLKAKIIGIAAIIFILMSVTIFNFVMTYKNNPIIQLAQKIVNENTQVITDLGVTNMQLVLKESVHEAQLMITVKNNVFLDFTSREVLMEKAVQFVKPELVRNNYKSIEIIFSLVLQL